MQLAGTGWDGRRRDVVVQLDGRKVRVHDGDWLLSNTFPAISMPRKFRMANGYLEFLVAISYYKYA